MQFRVNPKARPIQPKVHKQDYELARKFARQTYKEFGTFISSLILFGSTTYKNAKSNDIDLLIIIDDVRFQNEIDYLKAYFNVFSIRLIVSDDRRLKRLRIRDGYINKKELRDVSERKCDKLKVDYIVNNNGLINLTNYETCKLLKGVINETN